MGALWATLVAAEMHEALGNPSQALGNYEAALRAAREVSSTSSERNAKEGIERLRRPTSDPTLADSVN